MYRTEFRHPVWRKAARSFANNECVEVAQLSARTVGLRDSKLSARRDCPVLLADAAGWEGFTEQIKSGTFGS
ncbi:DUF397 domain-containing protein [Stackebrandtia nassauensis]|uniref:DUF397 domain-containing protein n=1 Tax=Stackebrandtia nassauensis (strain DSM 44728 / CIP 108903 / NRRL B-16338 / NBRC 102104 / LLR-40K-21) TaxID=446470 RepID=D3PY62_STANL|nr:DUF397 domain-containing protein [Stackebrandtia nassauensis]ADD45391.1 hypothetical protein Snas_5761 [Stackebrandtia nassauensis DSM 44728]